MTPTVPRCFDSLAAATALPRWGLGLLFLFTGLGKFYYQGKWSWENARWFVTGFLLEDKFRESFLPRWLLMPYGTALPYVEITLGVLLLLGLARNLSLFAAGLLLLSLAFGAILMKDYAILHENLFFLCVTAALLAVGQHDRWRPGTRQP
jgi:hypothetical protein